MFVTASSITGLKNYALRFVFVMGTSLLLAYLVKLIFAIDMHKEFIFAGAIGMVISSAKKKYIPKKQ